MSEQTDTTDPKTLMGYVLFQPFATGSKSESIRPAFVCGHGPTLTMFMEGDNPFENNLLRPFHGKYIEATGEVNFDKRNFRVHEIKELPDPFVPPENDSVESTQNSEDEEIESGSEDSQTDE
jgi:hypothetical protein